MELKINVPEYNPENGFEYQWQTGFDLKIQYEDGSVVITANKAGLYSLANHLLNLSQDEIPEGYHLHFDTNNSLEEGSVDLIIQKSS